MSTELVKVQNQGINLFDPAQFETLQRVCNVFIHSDLVPKMYKVSADNTKEKAIANCMIAVNMAHRMGADALMVMQNMYIVHGQPGWSSKFLIATVNTCGRYNTMKYKTKNLGKIKVPGTGAEIDNIECIAYTSEIGSEEVLESSAVTIEMAIKEGWYTKNGSKWQTMPMLMLQYRTATFWTRVYAPELSMGMRSEDELRDIEDVPYEEIPTKTKVETEIKNEANKETIGFDAQEAAFEAAGKAETSIDPKNEVAGTQQATPATDQQADAAAGNGQPKMKF